MLVLSPDGSAIPAEVEVRSFSRDFHQNAMAASDGRFTANHLTFGTYQLQVRSPGFALFAQTIQITSTVPQRVIVHLSLAAIQQTVDVSASATLLDEHATGASVALGRTQLQDRLSAQPGRELLDLIADQPGWLFEANGVLHPRGSEYETQFVVNGVPRTENLSPSFASPLSAQSIESAQIRTAGIPAEYGRSLGGIIDITTGAGAPLGWHGQVAGSGGSFDTAEGDATLTFATARQQLLLAGGGTSTDRFLDPPVVQNFTNHAFNITARADEQVRLSSSDRLEFDISHAELHADVPNEALQQIAGQQQARWSRQEAGSLSWQHQLSPDLLLMTAGSVLDSAATLDSNSEATPIFVTQDRGFRQGWMRADLAVHTGRHDWKIGADALLRHVHERLNYTITDPGYFDPDTQPTLSFAQALWDAEPAAFLEDTMRLGRWNLAAGLRFDDYSFILHRHAWSPRLSLSRFIPAAHLMVHASYDRIFQVPAMENLLLASSPQLDSVSDSVQRLPVEPARGHFYEIGFTQAVANKLRITGNIFLRTFRNVADDDTLLNTGVSFPISDRSARIHGEELALDLPATHGLFFRASYSNQNGTASGPINGGLLLGEEGSQELSDSSRFAISQDQRNTVRAQLRWSPRPRLWFALHEQYNSGLPVELDNDPDFEALAAAYGQRVLGAVNFDRGRIRPWSSLDLAAGTVLVERGDRRLRIELQVANVQNRLNVINFASLFSGTAIAPPRSATARLRYSF